MSYGTAGMWFDGGSGRLGTRVSISARTGKFDCQVTIDVFASNNSIMPDGLAVSAWEARVLGKLGDHPNIARVVDQWEDDQAAIMVSGTLPAAPC
jgi:hypothetical protein